MPILFHFDFTVPVKLFYADNLNINLRLINDLVSIVGIKRLSACMVLCRYRHSVMEHIVEQTDGYPFFTQVWGDCLARRVAETGETEITLTRVEEAKPAVIDERDAMYDIRFNEIKRMRLLSIAESVADTFIECGERVLYESALDKAIERGMVGDESITNERGMEALDQLFHLGYIWRIRVPGGYAYEPGIPSLMTYVYNQMQANKIPSIAGYA